jgi:hypothetical protein
MSNQIIGTAQALINLINNYDDEPEDELNEQQEEQYEDDQVQEEQDEQEEQEEPESSYIKLSEMIITSNNELLAYKINKLKIQDTQTKYIFKNTFKISEESNILNILKLSKTINNHNLNLLRLYNSIVYKTELSWFKPTELLQLNQYNLSDYTFITETIFDITSQIMIGLNQNYTTPQDSILINGMANNINMIITELDYQRKTINIEEVNNLNNLILWMFIEAMPYKYAHYIMSNFEFICEENILIRQFNDKQKSILLLSLFDINIRQYIINQITVSKYTELIMNTNYKYNLKSIKLIEFIVSNHSLHELINDNTVDIDTLLKYNSIDDNNILHLLFLENALNNINPNFNDDIIIKLKQLRYKKNKNDHIPFYVTQQFKHNYIDLINKIYDDDTFFDHIYLLTDNNSENYTNNYNVYNICKNILLKSKQNNIKLQNIEKIQEFYNYYMQYLLDYDIYDIMKTNDYMCIHTDTIMSSIKNNTLSEEYIKLYENNKTNQHFIRNFIVTIQFILTQNNELQYINKIDITDEFINVFLILLDENICIPENEITLNRIIHVKDINTYNMVIIAMIKMIYYGNDLPQLQNLNSYNMIKEICNNIDNKNIEFMIDMFYKYYNNVDITEYCGTSIEFTNGIIKCLCENNCDMLSKSLKTHTDFYKLIKFINYNETNATDLIYLLLTNDNLSDEIKFNFNINHINDKENIYKQIMLNDKEFNFQEKYKNYIFINKEKLEKCRNTYMINIINQLCDNSEETIIVIKNLLCVDDEFLDKYNLKDFIISKYIQSNDQHNFYIYLKHYKFNTDEIQKIAPPELFTQLKYKKLINNIITYDYLKCYDNYIDLINNYIKKFESTPNKLYSHVVNNKITINDLIEDKPFMTLLIYYTEITKLIEFDTENKIKNKLSHIQNDIITMIIQKQIINHKLIRYLIINVFDLCNILKLKEQVKKLKDKQIDKMLNSIINRYSITNKIPEKINEDFKQLITLILNLDINININNIYDKLINIDGNIICEIFMSGKISNINVIPSLCYFSDKETYKYLLILIITLYQDVITNNELSKKDVINVLNIYSMHYHQFDKKIINNFINKIIENKTIHIYEQLNNFIHKYFILISDDLLSAYPEFITSPLIHEEQINMIINKSLIEEQIYNTIIKLDIKSKQLIDKILKIYYDNNIDQYIDYLTHIDMSIIKVNKIQLIKMAMNNNELFESLIKYNIIDLDDIIKLKNHIMNYCLSYQTEEVIIKYIEHYTLDMLKEKNIFDECVIKNFINKQQVCNYLINKFQIDNLASFYIDIYYYGLLYNIITTIPSEILIKKDDNNRTYIMNVLMNIKDESIILDLIINNDGLFDYKDNNKHNLCHYLIIYQPIIFQMLLNKDIITKNMLINNSKETFIMFLIKHSQNNKIIEEIIKEIINKKYLVNQLYSDINNGSVFTYIIKYNIDLFDIFNIDNNLIDCIMSRDTSDIIYCYSSDYKLTNISLNIVQLSSIYNHEILDKLLKLNNKKIKKLMKEEININSDKINIFKIAVFNNPESTNVIIMNSNQETINEYIKSIESFDDIVDNQPGSWYYINSSSKFNNIKLNMEGHHYGYNYKNKLLKNTIGLVTHYILDKQELYTDSKNKCQLCETYKTKVVFTICKHKFCIGCSVKSKCCQVCKTNIKEEEKVLY